VGPPVPCCCATKETALALERELRTICPFFSALTSPTQALIICDVCDVFGNDTDLEVMFSFIRRDKFMDGNFIKPLEYLLKHLQVTIEDLNAPTVGGGRP